MTRPVLRGDDGVAIISAIAIGFVLTLAAVTMLALAISNDSLSGRARRSTQAFHTADAGFNQALFVAQTNDMGPTETSRVMSATIDGVSYVVTIERPDPTTPFRYEATSISTTSSGERRTVNGVINAVSVWDFQFAGAGAFTDASSSRALSGNVKVYGNIYGRGDLVLLNGTEYHAGSVYAKADPAVDPSPEAVAGGAGASGNLVLGPSTTIGNPTVALACNGLLDGPVDVRTEGKIVENGGVRWTDHEVENALLVDLKMPHLDDALMLQYYSSGADWKLDGDTDPNKSQPPLLIGSGTSAFTYTYSYKQRDPLLPPIPGTFAWNPITGLLHIDGIVFVDGDLILGDTDAITYEGWGTLVVNGKITVNQSLRPLALATFPTVDVLGLVSSHAGPGASVVVEPPPPAVATPCDFEVAAAVFGRKSIHVGSGVRFTGALVAGRLSFGDGESATVSSHPLLSSFLPPGLPGDERIAQIDGFSELPS